MRRLQVHAAAACVSVQSGESMRGCRAERMEEGGTRNVDVFEGFCISGSVLYLFILPPETSICFNAVRSVTRTPDLWLRPINCV